MTAAAPAIDLARPQRVAAEHAEDVDRSGRFPVEAVDALRAGGLLAAAAPVALGGLGLSRRELVDIAERLARGCASTAMIWAMHQIQLACLVAHGTSAELTERICRRQWLLASATSEVGVGGDIRRSIAALDRAGNGYTLTKQAATISYGEHCDGILATLRRDPDAAPNDQVLVLVRTEDAELIRLSEWDALGMRGTGSAGFEIRATVSADQVLPDPFARIAERTMVPYSHLLWAGCWTGVAAAALERARAFQRNRSRKHPGAAGASTSRLAHASATLQFARSSTAALASALDGGSADLGERWDTAVALNNLKYAVSRAAVEVTQDALAVCGFAGYQERGPFSVARHVRDALSGPLMVANDRLLDTSGALLVGRKGDEPTW